MTARGNSFASREGFAVAGPSGDGGDGGVALGILELVENKDFDSAGTSHTFAGLDGDEDEIYLLVFRIIKNGAPTITTTIRPNGLTTNQATQQFHRGTNSGNTSTSTVLMAGDGGASGSVETGRVWIHAKTGTRRTFESLRIQTVSSDLLLVEAFAYWNETATNITSLEVVCDQASGIGAGSYLRLYKLKKEDPPSANLRRSAWMFGG